MAQYALDDAVGIPVGICVVLSTELNADRISYLFGLSSVISKTDNKTCDIKFPLLSLVQTDIPCTLGMLLRIGASRRKIRASPWREART